MLSHVSSELNLLKDRALDRSQKRLQDSVNSFPPGNSVTAANEFNFSRPDSATTDHPVQDNALSNPPENSCNVAGNLNHLEMLSQHRRPGVAISIAPLSKRQLGVENTVKQASVEVQNVALPPLQPHKQPPRPPTTVMAQSMSYVFAPSFSTKSQAKSKLRINPLYL